MELIESDKMLNNQPLAVTVGFFDGVHIGHQYLIDQLVDVARAENLASAVISFPVHPRQVLQADYRPALLCGYREKIDRLSKTSLDYCIPIDFTPEISKLTAKDFIQKLLKEKYNVKVLLVGYDHRFGYNRADDFPEYVKYGKEVGIDVIKAGEMSGDHVSSSRIRRILGEGDILRANQLLGYNYTISGKIIEGFKVGRTIGFPTANIKIWEQFKVIPPFGVYAVYVRIDGSVYKGMLYIGKRPTLQNSDDISLEVNIFSFDGNLYDKELTAEFVGFIRLDQKFDSLEILKKHIQEDKLSVVRLFKKIEGRNNL